MPDFLFNHNYKLSKHFLCFSTSVAAPTDERKIIKAEELPQVIKDALAVELNNGWKITKVEEIKLAGFADKPEVAKQYHVYLAKNKDSKTAKFYSDGAMIK